MKVKAYILEVLSVFLNACDGLEVVFATVSCAEPSLAIELVDDDGTNLIANGIYSIDEIRVFKDDNQVNPNQDPTDEVIFILLSGQRGDDTYQIDLSDGEIDTLVLNLLQTSSGGGDCCNPSFSINKAMYNMETVELGIDEQFGQKITVIK